jgi:hypothetical protein
MIVNVWKVVRLKLDIKAKITDNEECTNLQVGNLYDVEEIDIGQSSTSIKLKDYEFPIRFVHNMKFYHRDKEIDIFKSKAFNPYLGRTNAQMVHYGEMKRPEVPKGLPF